MWLLYSLLLWAVGVLLVMALLYAYGEQERGRRAEI